MTADVLNNQTGHSQKTLSLYSAAAAISLSHAKFRVTVAPSSCFFLSMNEYSFNFSG